MQHSPLSLCTIIESQPLHATTSSTAGKAHQAAKKQKFYPLVDKEEASKVLGFRLEKSSISYSTKGVRTRIKDTSFGFDLARKCRISLGWSSGVVAMEGRIDERVIWSSTVVIGGRSRYGGARNCDQPPLRCWLIK